VKRQNYLETSSFSRRTGNVDVAAVILDDAVGSGEAEARAAFTFG